MLEKMSFYTCFIRTSGHPHNNPLLVAGVLFKDGVVVKWHNKYYKPFRKMIQLVNGTYRLTMEYLEEKGAKPFWSKDAIRLYKFFTEYKDLPIVGHHIEYDRDKVLKPAFEKINNSS